MPIGDAEVELLKRKHFFSADNFFLYIYEVNEFIKAVNCVPFAIYFWFYYAFYWE